MNSRKFAGTTVAALVFLSGCATEYIEIDRTVPPYYRARNFYLDAEAESKMPNRVLVLPCFGNASVSTLRLLDEVLAQELGKLTFFEVVPAPPEKTMNRRGQQEFTLNEAQAWAQAAGASGILQCRVTSCNPYRPLALGVSMKLWGVSPETTVWAVEETADSQLTLVANGARDYYLSNFRASYPTRRSEQILESPRMFFQYAFHEFLATLKRPPPTP
ncbi:MAG: hypothetical protein HY360_11730 [Verrucomicrobia bacterium]|nr:hypothetical protein [Verrucomicrobiota bacterium]